MSPWNQSRRGQKHQSTSSSGLLRQLADRCLQLVDLGLGAIVFAGPHLFGGRHLLGWFVIIFLCIATASIWFMHQLCLDEPRWTRTPVIGLLLAAIAWVAFQITPLPAQWLAELAPQHAEILTAWNTDSATVSLGQWKTLSLAPEETRLALATLIAYVLLFVTTVQRMETFDDVKRMTTWIASSAIIVAAFAVIQYFTANGKFFWFYEHPYVETTQGLKAGFTSRNHLAHFLVLGLANLLAWLMLGRTNEMELRRATSGQWGAGGRGPSDASDGYSSMILGAAVALVIFAVLASLSRGGILAMLAAIGVAAAVFARARLLSSVHFFAGSALLLLMLTALSFSGSYESLAQRMDTLTSSSVDEIDAGAGRRKIWFANAEALRASLLTGWGAGSHRFVYPLYIGESTPREFTHAENGYLQIATENGVPGLLMLAAGIITCGSWCFRTLRSERIDKRMRIVAGGIAAALTASIIHSVVDFVWFIPACMTATVLLAACAMRLSQLAAPAARQAEDRSTPTPLTRLNMALAVGVAGVWVVVASLPAAQTSLQWDAYVRTDQAIQASQAAKATASESRLAEIEASEALNGDELLRNLAGVVRVWPNSARAQARLAGALLNRFESLQQASDNAMTISQIRDAAVASQFQSPKALRNWLIQAFGENSKLLYLARHHALHALQLCPLQGEVYLYLAELAFLEGRGPEGYAAYAAQGLRVRPSDTSLLFAIGKNHLVAGSIDEALGLWSRAYRGTGTHQFHIVQILAGRMTADHFLKIFAPDWRTLEMLWSNFRQAGTAEDLQMILRYAAERARQETATGRQTRIGHIWLGLARMQTEMCDSRSALESLQLAYAASPDSLYVRRALGQCLLAFEKYELAESHLRWCVQHYPNNPALRKELQQATRGKMEQLARTTRSYLK